MNKVIEKVIKYSLESSLPDVAVREGLEKIEEPKGRRFVLAIGKAAYQMAKATLDYGLKFDEGLVITKYGYLEGDLPGFECFEAGHPILDENSIRATDYAIEKAKKLNEEDQLIFLISGGGSALFESPLISLETLEDINQQLLAAGANIVEINTIRKRISKVKGGKFGNLVYPAKIYNIILSDVVGNRLDMIASGPTYPDFSTSRQALDIVKKYDLQLSKEVLDLLKEDTVKELENVTSFVSGSVEKLCQSARDCLGKFGYECQIMTSLLSCEAKEAGSLLGSIGAYRARSSEKRAFIFGGETVVHLHGKGRGGRNQELVFAAAKEISGFKNVTIFSLGSDGTDGPTDAAGAFCDGTTLARLEEKGLDYEEILANNDTYTGLAAIDQLIVTGPTGTNVNDLSVVLIN